MNFSFQSDYSYLFSSMGTSGSSGLGNLNFLSDYMSIKNGSYGKLLKAYYGQASSSSSSSSSSSTSKSSSSNFINELMSSKKTDSDDTTTKSSSNFIDELMGSKKSDSTSTSTSTSKDSAKTLANIKSSVNALKESADALLDRSDNSLFNAKVMETEGEDGTTETTYGLDVDAIYKNVKSFVDNYNKLVTNGGNSDSQSIQKYLSTMINDTKSNANALSKIGITINSDNTLSIDEKAFKASDMNGVKSLFNGYDSYAYSVSTSASFIGYAAERESGKANTYNAAGSYTNNYSSGSIYSSYY